MSEKMSNRGLEWISFSALMLRHIEEYTVPQYGDKPDDQLHQDWKVEDCLRAINKYANRHGKGKRGQEEELRDLLKIAHYACAAHTKYREGKP